MTDMEQIPEDERMVPRRPESHRQHRGSDPDRACLSIADAINALAPDVRVLKETPMRFARALREMLDGYDADPSLILKCFDIEGDHGIVHVKNIAFASLCEHHILPFTGTVSIAYIPKTKIVGLSKIPRLVRALSHRLQVQERLGKEIGDAIWQHVDPLGVAVLVRGNHTCAAIRGVNTPCEMVTSYLLGCFRSDDPDMIAARAEVISLLK